MRKKFRQFILIKNIMSGSGVQSAIQVGQRQYGTDEIFTRLR